MKKLTLREEYNQLVIKHNNICYALETEREVIQKLRQQFGARSNETLADFVKRIIEDRDAAISASHKNTKNDKDMLNTNEDLMLRLSIVTRLLGESKDRMTDLRNRVELGLVDWSNGNAEKVVSHT